MGTGPRPRRSAAVDRTLAEATSPQLDPDRRAWHRASATDWALGIEARSRAGERRRVDARERLRSAHEVLAEIGADAFAERALRELAATGETVRRRTAETSDVLTPQEIQIARLAADGHTNPEIGAQSFISPRTVEYHVRKVFASSTSARAGALRCGGLRLTPPDGGAPAQRHRRAAARAPRARRSARPRGTRRAGARAWWDRPPGAHRRTSDGERA